MIWMCNKDSARMLGSAVLLCGPLLKQGPGRIAVFDSDEKGRLKGRGWSFFRLGFFAFLLFIDIGEQGHFSLLLAVIGALFLAFPTGKVPFTVNVEEPSAAEGYRTQFTLTMSAHSSSFEC